MAAPYCRTSFADGQTSGTSNRTVTGTPAVGDLWILLVSLSGNTSGTVTATDTNGGKYVALPNALFGASANNLVVLVRTQFFANTTPTTVTVNSGSNTAGEIVVLAYQGLSFPGLNAVRNSGSQANQAASGTPAPLMGGSALVSNPILSVIANSSDPGGVTKPSGWTLQQDAGQNTPNTGITVATLDSGFSGTTVTWGGPSATGFASYAVELDASYEPVVQSFGSTQLLWYFGGRSSLLNTGSAIWTPTIGISTIVGTTSPAATTLPNGVMLPTWNGTSSQLSTNGNNEVNHAIELQTLPALSNYQRVSFIVCESTQSQAYALRFNNDGIGLNTSGLNAGKFDASTVSGSSAKASAASNNGKLLRAIFVGDDASKVVNLYLNGVAQVAGSFTTGDWGSASEWGSSGCPFVGADNGILWWNGQLGLFGFAITQPGGVFSAANVANLDAALAMMIGQALTDPLGRMGNFGI